jgi:hypothetical protein
MTDPFETRIETLAKALPYPPTPRIAQKVMARLQPRHAKMRLAWRLAIAMVIIAGLMAVPPVRAAVLEFIRIGVVRIFPAPEPAPTSEAPRTAEPEIVAPITATPVMQANSLIPFLERVSGEISLEEARERVDFPIPLPTYPSDLGQPDHVFLQDANGWMVVLVWLEPKQPDQIRMSLHIIEESSWTLDKYQPTVIRETTVNGLSAVWTEGEYPLLAKNGDIQWMRLVVGHVLIWADGKVTYRLETNLSMEEAVQSAESLQAPP